MVWGGDVGGLLRVVNVKLSYARAIFYISCNPLSGGKELYMSNPLTPNAS